MLRTMRSAVWMSCLIACVGLIALWVRSTYWHDTIYLRGDQQHRHWQSWEGRLTFVTFPARGFGVTEPMFLSCKPADEWRKLLKGASGWEGELNRDDEFLGFVWASEYGGSRTTASHWFFVLIAAGLAILVKPKPRLKFTMLDLIVGMTLGAVGWAVLTAFVRSVAIAG